MTDAELGAGKTCFIVSPIGDSLAPHGSPANLSYEQSLMMWSKVFEPACEKFGLTIVRADKISSPGEIPEQIFAYLRDAEVVIADLSGANPNVMYELGLRHSRPRITIQVGEWERIPFDVATIRTIQFHRHEAGLIEVRDKLIDTLRTALESGAGDLRATQVFNSSAVVGIDLAADALRSAQPESDVRADEPGIIEVLAESEIAIEHVADVLSEASEIITRISEITNAATEEASSVQSQPRAFAARLTVVQRLSQALSGPSTELESSASEFVADIGRIDLLVQYVVSRAISGEEDTSEVRDFLANVVGLVDAAEEAAIGITGMRDSVRDLRRLSKALADVSRAIERALDRYLEGILQMHDWRELIEGLDLPTD